MAGYLPTFDIWTLTECASRGSSLSITSSGLRRGQYVSAGAVLNDRSNVGIYCGQKASGALVVAWLGNARRAPSFRGYVRTLMDYANDVQRIEAGRQGRLF